MFLSIKGKLRYSSGFFVGIFLLMAGMDSSIFAKKPYTRLVQKFRTSEFGISNPAGIAFSRAAGAFLIAPRLNTSEIKVMSDVERVSNSVALTTAIRNATNIAFDDQTNRLLFFDDETNEVVEIDAKADWLQDASVESDRRYSVKLFNASHLQGMTVDPRTGDIFFLVVPGMPESARIVRVISDPKERFDGSAAVRDGRVHNVVLKSLSQSQLRGIAFNPNDGHLYVMSTDEQELYEITEQGDVVSTRDLSAFGLSDVQNMLFAPSGDQTDYPAIASLYIAYSGLSSQYGRGDIAEFSLIRPQVHDLSPIMAPATLVQTILTYLWSPPSPDPSGGAYFSPANTLLISDGEVDEMPIFAGDNVWETTLSGAQVQEFTTDPAFSDEPTGVAYNPSNQHLYFTDDTGIRMVYEMNPGTDELYGTSDDIITSFRTAEFGSTDPEGIAYDIFQGHLFIADGLNAEVYELDPGPNGVFDGVPPAGDDVLVNNFDTAILGLEDPEGVEFNSDNGTLFLVSQNDDIIVQTTRSGTYLQEIDFTSHNVTRPAGLIYAPTSTNPAEKSIYLLDRGVDNDSDPNENDGRIFEFSLGPSTPSIVIDDVAMVEGDVGTVNAIFTVTLSGISQLITVDYATSDGSATTAGNDYVAGSGQVVFEPGETSQPITVVINGDITDEQDETFFVNLSNAVNATIGDAQGTGTIIDDDGPDPVTVSFQDGINGYNGTRDTKLRYNFPTTNYGYDTYLELDGAPDESTLLFWDLASIPIGSIVQSVSIMVNVIDSSGATYEIYDLKRAWIEGEATWNEYASGQNWEVAGADGAGDRGNIAFGWIDGSNLGPSTTSLNLAGLAAVQSWVDDPSANHGFIIMDYIAASNSMDLSSRETPTIADRPKITVTYTTPNPTLTVGSPNGGESWEVGSSQTITWSSTGTLSDVKLEYSTDAGVSWIPIIASTPNTGSYGWTVPNDISTTVRVQVSDALDGDPSDMSDAAFSIVAVPTLTLTSPNGGEVWQGGNIENITWSSVGTSGTVSIEYSADSGLTWSDISPSTPDDGTEPWNVPDIYTAQALLRISDTEVSGPADSSDAIFTIIPAAALITSFQDGVDGYNGTRDTHLKSAYPNTNFWDITPLELDGHPDDESILIFWNFASIPIGSTVYSVAITFYTTHASSNTYEIYQMKRAWIEDQATWNAYASGLNWEVAGADGSGDRGSTVLGSISPSTNGLTSISLDPEGAAMVQSWINDPSSNHGFIVMNYGNNNQADFSSREAAVANRPKITVIHAPSSPAVLVSAKIFLEGPYNSSTGEMGTNLNTSGYIPEASPYSEDSRSITPPIPADITDWVLVQLRETATGVAVGSRSALLRKDGLIVGDNGTTEQITVAVSPGNYYIVVKHRNHLTVMSASSVPLSSGSSTLYDFTSDISQYYGGGAKELEPGSGVWGMFGGNADNGDQDIFASDLAAIKVDFLLGLFGYYLSDVDMDGDVFASDYALGKINFLLGAFSTVP